MKVNTNYRYEQVRVISVITDTYRTWLPSPPTPPCCTSGVNTGKSVLVVSPPQGCSPFHKYTLLCTNYSNFSLQNTLHTSTNTYVVLCRLPSPPSHRRQSPSLPLLLHKHDPHNVTLHQTDVFLKIPSNCPSFFRFVFSLTFISVLHFNLLLSYGYPINNTYYFLLKCKSMAVLQSLSKWCETVGGTRMYWNYAVREEKYTRLTLDDGTRAHTVSH